MMNQEILDKYQITIDISLRNQIVEDHLYMVNILIKKYLNKGVDYDDLYQVGAMALISAVERFDPSKGYDFSSFATPTIIGEIKKHFRDKEWSLKVPRRLKELTGKMQKVREEMAAELHREPTVDEMAERLDVSTSDIIQSMESSMAYNAFSLNQTFDESGEEGDASMFEKFTAVDEAGFDRLEYAEIIQKVLSEMSETNKYIFRSRFIEDKSQAEIAEELGVSQMTVSRAEKTIRQRFQQEVQH